MRFFCIKIAIALLSAMAFDGALAADRDKVDLSRGLPLPVVPDSLRVPADRADFVVTHFWDDMDFGNRKYALDDIFIEQAFSDYAHLLQIAREPVAAASVAALMKSAAADADAYVKIADTAQKYLFEEDSPVYSEAVYKLFAQTILADTLVDDARRGRLEYQIECILKNVPGSIAADFSYVGHDGAEHSLLASTRGKEALVIFYDPDCEDCHKAIGILSAEPAALALTGAGRLAVLAIADSYTRERWAQSPLALPDGWVDGCDVTGIQDEDLYVITHTPTFYWLGTDGKVVIKNGSMGSILERIVELDAHE